MRRLRVLGLGAAMILTAGLGICLILAGGGIISLSSVWDFFDALTGAILVILVGALLILVSIHFLVALADERLNAALFHHKGDWGRIDVSPTAIRESIASILRKDIGLDQFRIQLSHRDKGVGITVRTSLSPEHRLTDVGERIQRELAERIADQTGVEVTDVTVLVRNIRPSETSLKETRRDENNS